MNKIKYIFIITIASISFDVVAVDWKHYNNNPDFKPTTLPNGAIANTRSLTKALPLLRAQAETEAVKIMDKVWVLHGAIYAPVVIETPKGLLVFSTGENAKDGKNFRKVIREQISKKPVIGVFYDHAHYPYGTKTLIDGDPDVVIVAHPDANKLAANKSIGELATTDLMELSPHLSNRANVQFGSNTPKTGVDAMASPATLDLGQTPARLDANKTLKHGESMTIDGLEVVGYQAVTDTPDSLTFYIPKYDLVIDNVLWPMTNTYTLRGDGFRHPGLWMAALREIRDLKPKYILTVGAGSKILKGKDNITQTINAVLDSMAYIYDQSIRLTNQGIAPDQLKHHIQLPQALIDSSPYVNQFYGQWETYPEMYPVRNHGWFSGYAEDIHNLPKKVEADYMIQLAGGMDKMHASWKKAYNKAEYLWAKQLASYLYFSDPANKNSRQALADTFRKLGQYSEGLIVRNFYIEAALSLEGNEDITITGTQSAGFIESDVIRGVNYLRTRINPEKSKGVSAFLIFNIDGKTAGLDIRNSVAEFVENVESNYRPADVTLTVSANKFSQYYEGSLKAKDIASSKALKLLSIFDEYKHIPMYPTTH